MEGLNAIKCGVVKPRWTFVTDASGVAISNRAEVVRSGSAISFNRLKSFSLSYLLAVVRNDNVRPFGCPLKLSRFQRPFFVFDNEAFRGCRKTSTLLL